MTEQDGHEMLVARMKALEQAAMTYLALFYSNNKVHKTNAELKEELEQRVEKLAGWRN